MSITRVVDKKLLCKVNDLTIKTKLNRAFDPKALDELTTDTDVFTLTPIMVHEHAAGKPVDPHYRCIVNAGAKPAPPKTLVTGAQFKGFLDIPFDVFDDLPLAETATKNSNGPIS